MFIERAEHKSATLATAFFGQFSNIQGGACIACPLSRHCPMCIYATLASKEALYCVLIPLQLLLAALGPACNEREDISRGSTGCLGLHVDSGKACEGTRHGGHTISMRVFTSTFLTFLPPLICTINKCNFESCTLPDGALRLAAMHMRIEKRRQSCDHAVDIDVHWSWAQY